MYCPTCASPLPVGAMFCGECGRAVSSADLAAARRRAATAAEQVDAATPLEAPVVRPPATEHPRRPEPSGQPWWVRDRLPEAPVRPGDDGGDPRPPASVPAPPAWPVAEEARVESSPEPAPAVPRTDDRAVDAAPDEPSVSHHEEAIEQAGASNAGSSTAPAEAPVPLRTPDRHPDNGPRPTSAPLWTASLTPVTPERPPRDETETEHVGATKRPVDHDSPRGAEADGPTDGAGEPGTTIDPPTRRPTWDVPAEGDTAPVAALGRDFRPSPPADGTPASRDERADSVQVEVEVETEAEAEVEAEPTSKADVAHDVTTADDTPTGRAPGEAGDESAARATAASETAAPRRPAPVPLVEPGSATPVERCTQCGAEIGEDDIFCGECGAVVQSVALSFTGPIAPLPADWRPEAGSRLPRDDVAEPEPEPEPEPEREREPGATPDADHRSEPSPSRPSASVSPAPIDHVPGFRAERPPVTPRPTVADVPPAPSSSSAPAWRPRRPPVAPGPDEDDVDETRIVRRGPLGTEYVLQFSTGESISVDGTGLVGRAPAPQPGERFDQLVRIIDPGKSVSKTHLEFGQEAGALWISDRWSGNGTVVRPRDGAPRRADPGVRVRVTRGTRVEMGEQSFVVV